MLQNSPVNPSIPSGDDFFRAVVDSISSSLCVIDAKGQIVFVNRSWRQFTQCDGAAEAAAGNYLATCDRAAANQCEDARKTAAGLRALIAGETQEFSFEYPCHSPTEQRWFILTARPLDFAGEQLFVIKHKNITDLKLHEFEIERLSLTDPLTGLANRRRFDDFANESWRWHQRQGKSMSLILLDIDHFKRLNDEFGHSYGDTCLQQIAAVLQAQCRRPHDLVARVGGEEIAIVLGNMESDQAEQFADLLRQSVLGLAIPHAPQAAHALVTASLGVATCRPGPQDRFPTLYQAADQALYQAKDQGRNRVCSFSAQ